jgi:hypothetical protein
MQGKIYNEYSEPPQVLHYLMDVLALVASSTLSSSSQPEPSDHNLPIFFRPAS